MSDQPFILPPVPLMTAERARDVARAYKAWSEQLTDMGLQRESARAGRDSQWWMTYSLALSQTKGEAP